MYRPLRVSILTFITAALFALPGTAENGEPEDWTIDREASVFAVVIYKGGIGKALAHNHFVTAHDYESTLKASANDLESIALEFSVPAENLVFDDTTLQEDWFPAIRDAGLLEEPFSEKSPDTRQEVRKSALGAGQLNAAEYPEIVATVTGVTRTGDGGYHANLAVSIHGETVERPVPVDTRVEDGRLVVTASPSFRFTEFGMEPYSAFLGAVKNKDVFNIFVHLEATRSGNS